MSGAIKKNRSCSFCATLARGDFPKIFTVSLTPVGKETSSRWYAQFKLIRDLANILKRHSSLVNLKSGTFGLATRLAETRKEPGHTNRHIYGAFAFQNWNYYRGPLANCASFGRQARQNRVWPEAQAVRGNNSSFERQRRF